MESNFSALSFLESVWKMLKAFSDTGRGKDGSIVIKMQRGKVRGIHARENDIDPAHYVNPDE